MWLWSGWSRAEELGPVVSMHVQKACAQQLQWQLTRLQCGLQEAGEEGYGLSRIVLPLSSLAGWAMIAVGGLTAMQVLGVNIQPLLAVGGVSGLAFAVGAQTVTANAIAGINLVRLTRDLG